MVGAVSPGRRELRRNLPPTRAHRRAPAPHEALHVATPCLIPIFFPRTQTRNSSSRAAEPVNNAARRRSRRMKTVDRVVQGPGGNEGNSHHETLPPPLTSPRVLLVVPWPGRFCRPARREMSADARRAEDEVRAPGRVSRAAQDLFVKYISEIRWPHAACFMITIDGAQTPSPARRPRQSKRRRPRSDQLLRRRNAVARFRSRRWSAVSDRHWSLSPSLSLSHQGGRCLSLVAVVS